MSETVIILGAGASVEAGVPVMKDFLDVAERLLQANDVEDCQQDFKAVFSAISALEPVHSKTDIDLNNLESVFAAFEMANLVKKLPPLNSEEVEALPAALRKLISKTIEKKLKFPVTQDRLMLPYPYQDFAHLLKLIAGDGQWVKKKVSVITFNYDIAIDCAVSMFGFPEYHLLRTGPVSGPNLFKLHGSLNWFDCETCNRIVSPNAWQAICSVLAHAPEVYVRLETLFKTCPLCSKQLKLDPVIVPPTWNKGAYYKTLQSVWQAAAQELSTAEYIYVFGYSLPSTDHFFRYLLALGLLGGSRLKRFWVCDPDARVGNRFEELLGPIPKKRFKLLDQRFSTAIGRVNGSLHQIMA